MARKSPPQEPPEEQFSDAQDELLPSEAANDPTSTVNEINLKVQHHQELLLDLRRQQEEIERQKRELEELSRKQREFDEGRREIVEKLTRGLVLLEREEFEVKRELEQIKIVRDTFADHLTQTEGLNPADWSGADLPSELTKALARVDQAKTIYSQSRARLAALRQAEGNEEAETSSDLTPSEMASEEKSFGSMVREGFAYTLPLALIGIFLLIAYLALRH
jgi:predicted RNase H-like nuclease (RuvC/YqgF family)